MAALATASTWLSSPFSKGRGHVGMTHLAHQRMAREMGTHIKARLIVARHHIKYSRWENIFE